jgi:putative transposase
VRHPRLKPAGREVLYHVYNRIAGTRLDLPFGDVEKAHFLSLLHRLRELYTVEVLGFAVMGNHYHVIVFAPAALPSDAETCARYAAYYAGRRTLSPGSPACRRVAARLRDISWFFHDLQHQFSAWFNHTRNVPRRGALWAGRFKHTLLEEGLAVWNCWKYIEMNPVRAGLADDPADYHFSSYGQWCGRGRHPFRESLERRLLPCFQGLLGVKNLTELQTALRRDFALHKALGRPLDAGAAAGAPLAFHTVATRRMRYWTDGLVIGSKVFVTEIMTAARGAAHMAKRRLTAAADTPAEAPPLVCYKRLRDLPL